MDCIEELNDYIKKKSAATGMGSMDVLMALSEIAGIENFNPYRADDSQLKELALSIPRMKESLEG